MTSHTVLHCSTTHTIRGTMHLVPCIPHLSLTSFSRRPHGFISLADLRLRWSQVQYLSQVTSGFSHLHLSLVPLRFKSYDSHFREPLSVLRILSRTTVLTNRFQNCSSEPLLPRPFLPCTPSILILAPSSSSSIGGQFLFSSSSILPASSFPTGHL